MRYFTKDNIFDIETYPNFFSFVVISADKKIAHCFEISDRKDNRQLLFSYLDELQANGARLVGFNNLGFDYPVLHFLLKKRKATVKEIYDEAQRIIDSLKDEKFGKTISKKHQKVEQIDLFKINHFDNAAKSTSLKILKFNMKRNDLRDLPYKVGSYLTSEQMDKVIEYNIDDVLATLDFYYENYEALELREKLSSKYGIDFSNMNDSKIGGEIFIQEIENKEPGRCYKFKNGKKEINQTKRSYIKFNEILFPYLAFDRPEFVAIAEWFNNQIIRETNGVFSDILESDLGDVAQYAEMVIKKSKKMDYIPSESEIKAFKEQYPMGWIEDKTPEQKYSKKTGEPLKTPTPNFYFCWKVAENLNVVINGHKYVFGTGGIHSSIESKAIHAGDKYLIVDLDVSSFYPHLAIQNNVYPEHLGEQFCKTYLDLYNQRKTFDKNAPENKALKLSLNGTYGNSNNKYSPFYDPKYTMTITVNGQLSLCMLIERILELKDASSIQSNTDGITMMIRKEDSDKLDQIVKQWEKETKLEMERNDYSSMYIRDVNNYVAVYQKNNKVKLKGAYAFELEHHKDQSCLVVQKAASEFLSTRISIEEYIKNHKDKYDFMMRTKIPKSMRLVLVDSEGKEEDQQNVTRYYVSNSTKAREMVKIMPPTEGKEEDRRVGICVGNKVKVCNNILDFNWDIDYNYYINEANKLIDVFSSM